MIKLKNILTEADSVKEEKSFEEFAETRGAGAAKIAATAEELNKYPKFYKLVNKYHS